MSFGSHFFINKTSPIPIINEIISSITPPGNLMNKTFNGYYTEPLGSGSKVIESNGIINGVSITSNTTLYAFFGTNNGGNGDATM